MNENCNYCFPSTKPKLAGFCICGRRAQLAVAVLADDDKYFPGIQTALQKFPACEIFSTTLVLAGCRAGWLMLQGGHGPPLQ
jgi:hypothetical protein